MIDKISWLDHASFRISKEDKIYIDPWEINFNDNADIILITHSHYDHCSVEDINKLKGPQTTIVGPLDAVQKVTGNVRTVRPGDEIEIKNTGIKVIPAYNLNKNFHPRVNEWVGFVIKTAGVSIYFAGDTDVIPEMKGLKPDIAILPVGGHYTMGIEEALKAIEDIEPKIVIPMHYGKIIGSAGDAENLKKLASIPVEILKPVKQ